MQVNYKNKYFCENCNEVREEISGSLEDSGHNEETGTSWECEFCNHINDGIINGFRCDKCEKWREEKMTECSDDDDDFLPDAEGVRRNEWRLILIGKTGNGKSATGNTILNSDSFTSFNSGSSVTRKCKRGEVFRFERHLMIVDTPGLYDTGVTNKRSLKEIVTCVQITAPGPHAFILVLQSGKRFTKEEYDTVIRLSETFGEKMYRYLIIIFTMKDELERKNQTIDDYIKSVPDHLRALLQKCQNRYIAFNNVGTEKEKEEDVKSLFRLVERIQNENGNTWYTNQMYQEAEKALYQRMQNILKEREKQKMLEYNKLEEEISKKYKNVVDEKNRETTKQKEIIQNLKQQQLQSEQTTALLENKLQDFEKEFHFQQNRMQENIKQKDEENAKQLMQMRKKYDEEREKLKQQNAKQQDRMIDQLNKEFMIQKRKLQEEMNKDKETLQESIRFHKAEQQKLAQEQKQHVEALHEQLKKTEEVYKENEAAMKRDHEEQKKTIMEKYSKDRKAIIQRMEENFTREMETMRQNTEEQLRKQKLDHEQTSHLLAEELKKIQSQSEKKENETKIKEAKMRENHERDKSKMLEDLNREQKQTMLELQNKFEIRSKKDAAELEAQKNEIKDIEASFERKDKDISQKLADYEDKIMKKDKDLKLIEKELSDRAAKETERIRSETLERENTLIRDLYKMMHENNNKENERRIAEEKAKQNELQKKLSTTIQNLQEQERSMNKLKKEIINLRNERLKDIKTDFQTQPNDLRREARNEKEKSPCTLM